ncbi:MAG: hypothetical protein A2846_00645 [Candidatus Doudnabacteria bacterium RIFCSPHIGHO2_01_FULL_49_9]|uniref:Uncharacterized protein n=1 Tax=Candidatus Doudnabacteria bacterium RIFCSPHIGHO2_01_FULL_49_9 TaxID=1817827 RepID=A0A1F5NYU1_9BACT|nr:MAG: hypothetical protein A2846_00645 [Candidatus Doudnabacteria bacterium RIFCSPHIGHO2_01_FULL_49_9]
MRLIRRSLPTAPKRFVVAASGEGWIVLLKIKILFLDFTAPVRNFLSESEAVDCGSKGKQFNN